MKFKDVAITIGPPPTEQDPPETHNEDSSDDDGKPGLVDTTKHDTGAEAPTHDGRHKLDDILLVPQYTSDDDDEGDKDLDIEADVNLAPTIGV